MLQKMGFFFFLLCLYNWNIAAEFLLYSSAVENYKWEKKKKAKEQNKKQNQEKNTQVYMYVTLW